MQPTTALVNIHIRARAHDKLLIDKAVELLGTNRSQFMMTSALNKAKNNILDQTSLYVDNKAFQAVLDLLEAPASQEQLEGMQRLSSVQAPWTYE
jgi:uncharacterized protein (DUF1778 family)